MRMTRRMSRCPVALLTTNLKAVGCVKWLRMALHSSASISLCRQHISNKVFLSAPIMVLWINGLPFKNTLVSVWWWRSIIDSLVEQGNLQCWLIWLLWHVIIKWELNTGDYSFVLIHIYIIYLVLDENNHMGSLSSYHDIHNQFFNWGHSSQVSGHLLYFINPMNMEKTLLLFLFSFSGQLGWVSSSAIPITQSLFSSRPASQ